MAYRSSEALRRWLGPRAKVIDIHAQGHKALGIKTGKGRPTDEAKPLAHAYIIGMLGEFQGFARDLHDLVVERLVDAAGVQPSFAGIITEGLTRGRGLDRGNATVSVLGGDFARLGISLDIKSYNARWQGGDSVKVENAFRVRNALAHGNERALEELRRSGTLDTVSWARDRLPAFNRLARALDHISWDYLKAETGSEPWS